MSKADYEQAQQEAFKRNEEVNSIQAILDEYSADGIIATDGVAAEVIAEELRGCGWTFTPAQDTEDVQSDSQPFGWAVRDAGIPIV